jgi:hypothetical protein
MIPARQTRLSQKCSYGESPAAAASWRAHDGSLHWRTACPLLYRYHLLNRWLCLLFVLAETKISLRPYTLHTARSLACPLLTLSSAPPFSWRTAFSGPPLSSTSAELVSGLGLGPSLGLGSHSSSQAPSHALLLLATLLSHNIPFPHVQ